MKKTFILTKSKKEFNLENLKINDLPKQLALVYSSQYINIAKQVKKHLESNNFKITFFSQVLGCSKPKFPKETQTILLISDGKFHGVSLAYESSLPVYLYNHKLEKISEKQVEDLKKKQKVAQVKFLNSKKAGIVISTKSGQQRIDKAIKLKNKIKDKDIYFFLTNNLNQQEFENFPQIQSWVNTACPRLDLNENQMINISEL